MINGSLKTDIIMPVPATIHIISMITDDRR